MLINIILILPIMAAPATKIPVTATSERTGVVSGESWTTNGGVTHFRDYQVTYDISLNIEGEGSLAGISSNVWNGRVNTKTGKAVLQYNAIWSFPGGSFEGVIQSRLESYPPPYEYYEIHCVLKGTGVFEGQKLMLSYEGTTTDPVWEGFLLRPNN
jgi:hypothetical protein